MPNTINLKAPLQEGDLEKLIVGDIVTISGVIYTARDAAHKRFIELLEAGKKLPTDLRGQILYYVGPSPAKPGEVIGSAGPTTAYRMDKYTPMLLEAGLKGIIGKGGRSREVRDALVENKAVYFAAIGGAGAFLSKRIISAEVVAYGDLGPEAVHRLEVTDFPCFVANDIRGNDIYQDAIKQYEIKNEN